VLYRSFVAARAAVIMNSFRDIKVGRQGNTVGTSNTGNDEEHYNTIAIDINLILTNFDKRTTKQSLYTEHDMPSQKNEWTNSAWLNDMIPFTMISPDCVSSVCLLVYCQRGNKPTIVPKRE
jgi:hypothetical protein